MKDAGRLPCSHQFLPLGAFEVGIKDEAAFRHSRFFDAFQKNHPNVGQAIAIGLETKADELLDFVKKVNPQVRSRSTERIHMYDFPTGEGNAIDEVHFMFTQSDSKLARVTIIGITKPFQQAVADLSHWLVVKGAQKVQDPNKGEVIKHEGWTFSFWEGKSAYDQNVTEHGMDIIFDGRKADLGLDG